MSGHLCIGEVTGDQGDDLESNCFKICKSFMKNDLFDESTDIVSCFDVPLHPGLLCWLLEDDIEIDCQAAQAVCDILGPRNFQKSNFSCVDCKDGTDDDMGNDCSEVNDDGWEDDSLRLQVVFIRVQKGIKIK